MLLRLLSGAEESDFILLNSSSKVSSASILNLFLKNSKTEVLLLQTGLSSSIDGDLVARKVQINDPLSWDSSDQQKFPSNILDQLDPGGSQQQTLVLDSLTDLSLFNSPTSVARLLVRLKKACSTRAKLITVLHSDCVEQGLVEGLEQLATTCIKVTEGGVVVVRHRKPGGKSVVSKELVKVDTVGNTKVEAFKKDKEDKREDDDDEDVVDKLTTFNIATTKEKEREAKDKLVLPFYKEEQKQQPTVKEEVKIHKESVSSAIYYEPDSGDDWDDDDPDDDLDF